MNIPKSFKKALRVTFYDKDLTLCTKVTTTDDFGAVTGSGYEPFLAFKGSFQATASTSDTDESGQYTQSSHRVACYLDPSVVNQQEHVVLYDGQYYEIVGKYPTDVALILTLKEVGK